MTAFLAVLQVGLITALFLAPLAVFTWLDGNKTPVEKPELEAVQFQKDCKGEISAVYRIGKTKESSYLELYCSDWRAK